MNQQGSHLPQLDEWVAAFESQEEVKEKAKKMAMSDDGWTVVVRSKVRELGGGARTITVTAPCA